MQEKTYRIGSRIAFSRSNKSINATINQRVLPWQEALLFAWVLSWLVCGFFFVFELIRTTQTEVRTFMAVILGFWGYFLVKGVKIYFWRRVGSEKITITAGKMELRNAMGPFGKTQVFEAEKIEKIGLVNASEKNFFRFMESAFWSLGGETIGFKYGKKNLVLGKQLNERDTRDLLRLLEGGLKEFAKKS